ncbi:hypothetical protein [Streptomyces sp. BK340]|uniref:hypothetical protein n=1 Tax=Streptomyces sp. BK340 TaxID=2572903 RepID=UPI0011A2045D|nr:hypothetical protein [Streptomyces sp. BK340]TVZ90459.1 hypothetical protein FB157_111117 [Streptomyces sp. BK340]
MTTMDITHSRTEAPESAEAVRPSTRATETPMISELVVATLHLEHLAETAGPPEDETAAHLNGITPEQQRSFVLGNADRIRAALAKITAPYETPATLVPPDPDPAEDDDRDLQPPTCCPPTDVTATAVATFQETAAVYAVLADDRNDAQRIVAAMLPDERAAFASQLDELRKLIGLVCDNCGCLAELGTGTTDPFAEACRFLCGTCAVEIRRLISTASRRTKATNSSPAPSTTPFPNTPGTT